MKKRIYTYKILFALFLVLTGFNSNAQGNLVNILNEDYYGFEKGNDGWWMQHPDNFSISTEKPASGFASLKYTNPNTASGDLKAHGSATLPEMVINLDAGTYIMKAMVWLDPSAELTGFNATLKPIFANAPFNLSTVARGEWVEVTTQITLGQNVSGGNFLIVMDDAYGGKGTLYIDNIQLLDEAPPSVEEIPVSSEINTINGNNLSLEAGTYEIDLKVWLEANATMKQFYTIIDNPWVNTKWDISAIAKEEWVSLTEEFTIDDKADNAKFTLKVNNNPEYGGGKGALYIDEIVFTKKANAYEDPDNLTLHTTGETCPDKKNGQLVVKSKVNAEYELSFNGQTYDFSDEKIISDIAPGSYDVCVSVKSTTFQSCYKVEIEASQNITGKFKKTKSNAVSVSIQKGTPPYSVSVNDIESFETYASEFEVNAKNGDMVKIKTNKECEGIISEEVQTVSFHPNPVANELFINSPKGSIITIYNVLGNVVLSRENRTGNSESYTLNRFTPGIYVLSVNIDGNIITNKLIKQ